MDDIIRMDSVDVYNKKFGLVTLNPLVSVVDLAEATRFHKRFTINAGVFLSPNYFGDLVKKTTGKTPLDYIQAKITGMSKDLLLDTEMTVSQIADELGFQYPQHLNRMFKKNVGVTPTEYRKGEKVRIPLLKASLSHLLTFSPFITLPSCRCGRRAGAGRRSRGRPWPSS